MNNNTTLANNIELKDRMEQFEFHPEVYLYPTPRMYKPLPEFRLEQVNFTDEINVYVHIPFCKQICSFCGYLKTADSEGSRNLKSEYVDSVVKEIELYSKILKTKTVKTLHFGGGTPSLLAPEQLEKIINSLLKVNPDILKTSKEVSIESTPEAVEKNKFSRFMDLGINRVSLGVQTFDNSEIKLSNRNNNYETSIGAIKILQQIGIQNVVIDMMIGIEGQSVQSFEKSVSELIQFRPETVELYALGLMPQTKLGKQKRFEKLEKQESKNSMDNKEIYQCYNVGKELFLNAGYIQDAHNRYIIPHKGSFLQEDYVFQGMSLIGFGAGVRSYAKNMHYRNTYDAFNSRKAIVEYMKNINARTHSVESGIILNSDEVMRQYIIGSVEKMNKQEFLDRFKIGFEDKFESLYNELIECGALKDDGKNIQLTSKGLLFRDLICKQFFSEKSKTLENEYRA